MFHLGTLSAHVAWISRFEASLADYPGMLATGVAIQIGVTLDTIVRGRGFGRRLLEIAENKFHIRGLGRSWALMTNDNLRAAGLYLSRGYRLVRVHLDAVNRVREHKPELPEKGYEGIRIRDLWEFEKLGPLGLPDP